MTEKQRIESNYRGCVEEWKVSLVLSMVKRKRFAKNQHEDILQEVILDVKNFRWTPTADATEATVLSSAVNHWLIDIIRTQARKRKVIQDYMGLRESGVEDEDLHKRTVELPLDVRSAISSLDWDDRLICSLLMAGMTRQKIAGRFPWTWRQLNAAIHRISEHFKKCDLDEYVGRDRDE